MLSGRYMVQEPETAPLILLSLTDIPKRKKIEAALIQAEKLAIQLPQNHMQLRRSSR
jgi:two-component system, chemotaxis family, CheB/CheR fusion protein